jgi:hypothetical protein
MNSWIPLNEAPVRDLLREGPMNCIVYGPDIGVRTGRVWRSDEAHEGDAYADSFIGAWRITHWMPLPAPPTGLPTD